MRLLGATKVSDLNMQHVSMLRQMLLLAQYPITNGILTRSMLELWNNRSTMGPRGLRSLGCGYRPSCSPLCELEYLPGLSLVHRMIVKEARWRLIASCADLSLLHKIVS